MNNTISFINNEDAVLLDAYSRTITGVVSNVASSVAHIQVNKKIKDRQGKIQLAPASGSGFVISSDGYVVTNHHVIEEAEDVHVLFSDGRNLSAELKGADPSTDIAVLKIFDNNLKALSFTDSDRYRQDK